MSTHDQRNSALATVALTAAQADITVNALTVQQILNQVAQIQQVMGTAMKEGEHYGTIPGCGDKKTLLKPGAEKLCMMFRLSPQYDIDESALDGGHREYRVTTTLISIPTQANIGQGVGCCSTMEAKYRYRGGSRKCPTCGAATIIRGKAEYGGGWLCFAKKGGCGAKFKAGDKAIEGQSEERQENPDLADQFNTVLKMAKKRALVDAVLTATAASDIFTQDLEEITGHLEAENAIIAREERREEPSHAAAGKVAPRVVDVEAEAALPRDFRETRIHFGKNRGLMLSELTPQQVHWYESDWMPKKEVNGPASVEDLALIQALKTYRSWRNAEKARPSTAPQPPPLTKPEDETQEHPSTEQQLGQSLIATKVSQQDLETYLRGNKGNGGLPELDDDTEVIRLPEGALIRVLEKLPSIAPKIIADRRKREERELLSSAPLN